MRDRKRHSLSKSTVPGQTEAKPIWFLFQDVLGLQPELKEVNHHKISKSTSSALLEVSNTPTQSFKKVVSDHREDTSAPPSRIRSYEKTTWKLRLEMPPCTSVASRCVLRGIRGDLTPAVLTARRWGRSCCRIVPEALSR